MSQLGKWLMRYGNVDEALSPALRGAVGRIRSDLHKFSAGRQAFSDVVIEGTEVVATLTGRDARSVARQVERRLYAPLVSYMVEADGGVQLRIKDKSHESI